MTRARSLFTRLLLAQVVVTVVLTATLAALFYVERNRTVAELVAVRWAPALKRAAGGAPIASVSDGAPGTIYTAHERPVNAFEIASLSPRMAMLRDALLDEGLPLVDLALAPEEVSGKRVPVMWIALRGLDGATRWVGFESGVIETRWRERLVLAVVLLSVLAGVSHDLRSPLGRIRMAAELLPEGEGIAPKREIIVRNAAVADRLVGSFLDHVRSGELPLDETVDVAAIARLAAAQLPCKAAELTVEAPTVLLTPRANAVLIERMIANLLDNAFTHGRVPVTLRVMAPPGRVRIEVEDAGTGIAPDDQDAMLQAFARADVSRQQPGLGLGLAVVQRVAERLGGRVAFERSANHPRHVVSVEWPRIVA